MVSHLSVYATLPIRWCRARDPIDSAVEVSVCGESYTGECMPASVGAQVCELLIGLSSLDNSAAAGARTSRKYGLGSSLGLGMNP